MAGGSCSLIFFWKGRIGFIFLLPGSLGFRNDPCAGPVRILHVTYPWLWYMFLGMNMFPTFTRLIHMQIMATGMTKFEMAYGHCMLWTSSKNFLSLSLSLFLFQIFDLTCMLAFSQFLSQTLFAKQRARLKVQSKEESKWLAEKGYKERNEPHLSLKQQYNVSFYFSF